MVPVSTVCLKFLYYPVFSVYVLCSSSSISLCLYQCCVSGMVCPSQIPDLGSPVQKKEYEKNWLFPFFVAISLFFDKVHRTEKDLSVEKRILVFLTRKIVTTKIAWSQIRDPKKTYPGRTGRTRIQGSKTHRIPKLKPQQSNGTKEPR
jgi:hypothetical protein